MTKIDLAKGIFDPVTGETLDIFACNYLTGEVYRCNTASAVGAVQRYYKCDTTEAIRKLANSGTGNPVEVSDSELWAE